MRLLSSHASGFSLCPTRFLTERLATKSIVGDVFCIVFLATKDISCISFLTEKCAQFKLKRLDRTVGEGFFSFLFHFVYAQRGISFCGKPFEK